MGSNETTASPCPSPLDWCPPSTGDFEACFKACDDDSCGCEEIVSECCADCGGGKYEELHVRVVPDSGTCDCREQYCEDGYDLVNCDNSPAGILQRTRRELAQWSLPNPLATVIGSCTDGSCGTSFRISNVGGLVAKLAPPRCGSFDPPLELVYNTAQIGASDFGFLWNCTFRSYVYTVSGTQATIFRPDGLLYAYTNLSGTPGYYLAPPEARNSLHRNADSSWTETFPNGFMYDYEAALGALSRVRDVNGNRWTMGYDVPGGHLVSITNPFQMRTTLVYDPNDVIRRIVDCAGRITTFTVDANSDLISMTTPELCVTQLQYDVDHNLKVWISPEGDRTSFSYDANDLVTRVVAPSGHIATLTYVTSQQARMVDASGCPTTITVAESGSTGHRSMFYARVCRTTQAYDKPSLRITNHNARGHRATMTSADVFQGRKQSKLVQAPDNSRYSFTFDGSGRVNCIIDQMANRSTLVWDGSSNRVAVCDPQGYRSSWTYNARGQKTASINPLGQRRSFSYDAMGRKSAKINALGARTSFAYNAYSQVKRQVTPIGATTTFQRDLMNRVTTRIDPLARRTSYSYDTNGRKIQTKNPLGLITTQLYDLSGKPGIIVNPLLQRTTYGFDGNRNQIRVVNPLGQISTTVYDGANRVVGRVNPLGQRTTLVLDPAGNRIATLNPLGQRTSTVYDVNNRPVANIDALGNRSTTTYDRTGNVTSTRNPLLQITTNVYNNLNQRRATVSPLGYRTSYSYDSEGQQIAVTDSLLASSTTVYDPAGRVLAQVNPLGFRATSVFDAAGRAVASIDPLANRSTTVYDLAGQVKATINPLGFRTSFAYDVGGRRLRSQSPTGAISTSVYDKLGRVIASVDPFLRRTSVAYDKAGRQVHIENALGQITSTVYDMAGRVLASVNPLNQRTSQAYDAAGRRVRSQSLLGFISTSVYDAAGRTIASIDPLGARSSAVYDQASRVLRTVNPLGFIATMVYGRDGRTTASVNPLGYRTSFGYDAVGHQVRTQNALNQITTGVFNAAGWLSARVNWQGNRTSLVYDAAGRQIATINPLGSRVTTIYNPAGWTSATIDPLGNRTSYSYDGAGRRTAVVNALLNRFTSVYDLAGRLQATVNPLGARMSYSYDALNRVIAVQNALGRRTSSVFDAAGRQVAAVNALGYRTTQVFDAAGRRIAIVDARTNRNSFLYDAAGRLTCQIDPLWQRTTFGYDKAGQRVLKLDPRGYRCSWVYDAAGRQTSRQYSGGTRVTLSYDALGNRTRMWDSTGLYTFSYCCPSRLLVAVHPAGKRITYAYDRAERRSRMQEPDGGRFTYNYDAAGRSSVLVNPLNERTSWTYDAAGRVQVIRPANNLVSSYTYDAANQVTKLYHMFGPAVIDSSQNYQYDAAGNRVRMIEGLLNGDIVTWIYDKANQLVVDRRDGTSGYHITYTYDGVGNRIIRDDASGRQTLAYDAANQTRYSIEPDGNRLTYQYDAAGNLSRVGLVPEILITFTWDADNLATGKALYFGPAAGGPLSARNTYTYSGDGLMARRENETGAITKQVWDGQNILLETDDANTTQAVYTLEPRQYGNLVSQRRGADSRFFHFDAIGSTRLLSAPGILSLTDIYAYTAFGDVIRVIGATPNMFWYVGQLGYYHDLLGPLETYYVRARHYLPSAGMWASRDPLRATIRGLLDPYIYVAHSPVSARDPSGLRCDVCKSGVYKSQQLATLDETVFDMRGAFTTLARGRRMNAARLYDGSSGAFFPVLPTLTDDVFKNAGVYRIENDRGGVVAAYLFFVVFEICETAPGDCRLFFDESGGTMSGEELDGIPKLRHAGVNHGDVTLGIDQNVSPEALSNQDVVKRPIWQPKGRCDQMLIYCDLPVVDATTFRSEYSIFIPQSFDIRDASRGGQLISSLFHIVNLSVSIRGVITSSDSAPDGL